MGQSEGEEHRCEVGGVISLPGSHWFLLRLVTGRPVELSDALSVLRLLVVSHIGGQCAESSC